MLNLGIFSTLAFFFLSSLAFAQVQRQEPGLHVLGQHWYEKVEIISVPDSTAAEKPGSPTFNAEPTSRQLKTRKYFVYELTVRNEAGQTIKGFSWDYVFSRLENKEELSRRKFIHLQKINKGRTKTIASYSNSPPTDLIDTGSLEKDPRSPYSERVYLKCVVYGNNMTWKNENVAETECEDLRLNIKRREEALKKFQYR